MLDCTTEVDGGKQQDSGFSLKIGLAWFSDWLDAEWERKLCVYVCMYMSTCVCLSVRKRKTDTDRKSRILLILEFELQHWKLSSPTRGKRVSRSNVSTCVWFCSGALKSSALDLLSWRNLFVIHFTEVTDVRILYLVLILSPYILTMEESNEKTYGRERWEIRR